MTQYLCKHLWSSALDVRIDINLDQTPPRFSASWFDSALLLAAATSLSPAVRGACRFTLDDIEFDAQILADDTENETVILRRPSGIAVPTEYRWDAPAGLLLIVTDTIDTRAMFERVAADFGNDFISTDDPDRLAKHRIQIDLSGARLNAGFRRLFLGSLTVILKKGETL